MFKDWLLQPPTHRRRLPAILQGSENDPSFAKAAVDGIAVALDIIFVEDIGHVERKFGGWLAAMTKTDNKRAAKCIRIKSCY
jgi:hypothetical protein